MCSTVDSADWPQTKGHGSMERSGMMTINLDGKTRRNSGQASLSMANQDFP